MGGHRRFGQAPEILTRHELGRAEGPPGESARRRCGGLSHPLGRLRRGILPDNELGDRWREPPPRPDQRQTALLAAACADEGKELPPGGSERPRGHPPRVAPAAHHPTLPPP